MFMYILYGRIFAQITEQDPGEPREARPWLEPIQLSRAAAVELHGTPQAS